MWTYTWYVQPYINFTSGPTSFGDQFNAMAGAGYVTPPSAPQVIAPAGTYSSVTPSGTALAPRFSWTASPLATSYTVYLLGTNYGVIAQWSTDAAGAGCGGGGGICSLDAIYPPIANGTYLWQVTATNDSGQNVQSGYSTFFLDSTTIPSTFAPAPIAPSGTVSHATPTFSWNSAPWSRFYFLSITNGGATVWSGAYSDTLAGCPVGLNSVCSVTPMIVLAAGNYQLRCEPVDARSVWRVIT